MGGCEKNQENFILKTSDFVNSNLPNSLYSKALNLYKNN